MPDVLLRSFARWPGLPTVAALGSFGVVMVLPHMDAVQQGSLALLAAVTGGIELLCGFGAVIGMTHWCRPPAAAERPSFGGRLLPAKRAEAAGDGCVDNRRDPKRS